MKKLKKIKRATVIEERSGLVSLYFGKDLLTAGVGRGVRTRFDEIANLINVGR